MNLFLFLICNFLGLGAFAAAFVILTILNIAVLMFSGVAGIVIGVINLIFLIVFIFFGFPINGILIFCLVQSLIGIIAILTEPAVGIGNIADAVLCIIGLILFHVYLV